MQAASGRLEFERAALLRDQIQALRSGDFKKMARIEAKDYPTRGRGKAPGGKGAARKR
jgi:excinuclease ABC subunit B